MFDKERFEQIVYKLVTQEVNAIYSEISKQEGFRVQRQIIQALHFVIEETVMQISYGLAISPSR